MEINKYFWLIASYPRSGNTWCRIFISELIRLKNIYENKNNNFSKKQIHSLNINKDLRIGEIISDRNWLDDQLGISSSDLSFSELDLIRKDIYINKLSIRENSNFHKCHDAFFIKDSFDLPIVSVQNFKGVIYIIRNPFDVAVSLKYFFDWDQNKSIEFLLDKNAELCGSKKHGDIQCRQFLGTWENHYLSWAKQSYIPSMVMRYEDLIENPLKYFSKIANFLKLTKDKKLVEEAIRNVSFNKITRMEDDLGGFKENLYSHTKFFRSGKVGQARNALSKIQINLIKSSFRDTLKELYEREINYITNS